MPLETLFAEHEEAIRRFEAEWARGLHADLRAYVPAGAREPTALLAELAHIDLEFRYRSGERPCVEEYVSHYDDLRRDDVILDLLAGEQALRERYGAAETPERLRLRFPTLAPKLDEYRKRRADPDRTRTPDGRPARRDPLGPPVVPDFECGPEIGRGGMGVVYRAEQLSLNRLVALKTFAQVPSEKAAARFRREAEAMARLDHPNIVPVYKVGEWAWGRDAIPYLVMKWYTGGSLDTAPHGPGTPPGIHARTVETIAQAVRHAHRRGVLHRDLKPSNILLDDAGQPAVGDFGLAGWYDPNEPNLLTESLVGTPAFMAPEQARDPASVSTAADVYGLGAILYFLLTGHPPVSGPTALAVLDRLASAAPVRPSALNPAVSRDLETVCLKCLEKDPDHRYDGAEALAADLARWRQGLSISARRPGPGERAWRTVRRHPVVTAACTIAICSLVFAVIALAIGNHRVLVREAALTEALDREQKSVYLERVSTAGRLFRINQLVPAWHTLDLCPDRFRAWEWQYLDGVRRAERRVWVGVNEHIADVAFRSDDRVVFTDAHGRIRLWDTVGDPTEYPVNGNRLAAHPTKPWIAAADHATVIVADETGAERYKLPYTWWFGFDPTGKRFARTEGPTIYIHDADTGRELFALKGHTDQVSAGAFTHDGARLTTGSVDRTVREWDLTTGQAIGDPGTRPLPVHRLALTGNGLILAEAMPSALRFTNVKTRQPVRPYDRAPGRPTLATGADPSWGAAPTAPRVIVLRNAADGIDMRTYRGHVGNVIALAVNREGTRLVSGGIDGSVRVWDATRTDECHDLAPVGDTAGGLAIAADGRTLCVAHRTLSGPDAPRVVTYDAKSGAVLDSTLGCGDVAFAPNGQWRAFGVRDGGVTIVDRDGTERRRLLTASPVTRIRVSPDGRHIAAGTLKGVLHVWDVDDGTERLREAVHRGTVTALDWFPEGNRIAVGGERRVQLWDTSPPTLVRTIATEQTPVAVAFRPDGGGLAVAGRSRMIGVYDPETGLLIRELIGNPAHVNALAYHPSGTRLASAGEDGTVRVWDPESGKELLVLDGGSQPIVALGWASRGNRIIALGATIREWSPSDERHVRSR
jgi:WD40 repeat protein